MSSRKCKKRNGLEYGHRTMTYDMRLLVTQAVEAGLTTLAKEKIELWDNYLKLHGCEPCPLDDSVLRRISSRLDYEQFCKYAVAHVRRVAQLHSKRLFLYDKINERAGVNNLGGDVRAGLLLAFTLNDQRYYGVSMIHSKDRLKGRNNNNVGYWRAILGAKPLQVEPVLFGTQSPDDWLAQFPRVIRDTLYLWMTDLEFRLHKKRELDASNATLNSWMTELTQQAQKQETDETTTQPTS